MTSQDPAPLIAPPFAFPYLGPWAERILSRGRVAGSEPPCPREGSVYILGIQRANSHHMSSSQSTITTLTPHVTSTAHTMSDTFIPRFKKSCWSLIGETIGSVFTKNSQKTSRPPGSIWAAKETQTGSKPSLGGDSSDHVSNIPTKATEATGSNQLSEHDQMRAFWSQATCHLAQHVREMTNYPDPLNSGGFSYQTPEGTQFDVSSVKTGTDNSTKVVWKAEGDWSGDLSLKDDGTYLSTVHEPDRRNWITYAGTADDPLQLKQVWRMKVGAKGERGCGTVDGEMIEYF